jgi:hypothetical protein
MVKVIKEFLGCKDGDVYPVQFAVGDDVEGDLAEVALREGWAEDSGEEKSKSPQSNKMIKNAPENK